MDYCNICVDPPCALLGRVTGKLQVDTTDGPRRLLGELRLQAPIRLHFVQVDASKRIRTTDGRVLYAVTVSNQSSLPMTRVVVTGEHRGFQAGTVRISGIPAPEDTPHRGIEVLGLGPGCAVVVTWETGATHGIQPENQPIDVGFEYLFAGECMTGSITA